jgi:hypothetical protein
MSDIYLQMTETPTVVTLSAPVVSGALASTVTVANTVTVALDSNSLSALENVTVTVGAAVAISNFPATQTIAGTVTVNLSNAFINTSGGYQPVQFSTGLPVANEKDGITFDAIPFLVAGSVTIGSALPAGTNRIGVVTIGGGTVTIGAGTSQIGSVTAFLTYSQTAVSLSSTAATAIPIVFPTNGVYGGSLQGYNGTNTYIYSGIQAIGNTSLASATSLPVSLASLPALVAGTAQIGSVTASISNSVVTIYPMQGTTVTNSNFTSTTASTTLVSAVANREVLTVFNETGTLFISPGATCTTVAYQVRLGSGEYWECPQGQQSLQHTAVYLTTGGTARVCQVS